MTALCLTLHVALKSNLCMHIFKILSQNGQILVDLFIYQLFHLFTLKYYSRSPVSSYL